MQKIPAQTTTNLRQCGATYEAFIHIWLELVHPFTIDSYRARHNNIHSALEEFHRYLSRHRKPNPPDIEDLSQEVTELLQADPIIGSIFPNPLRFLPAFQKPFVGGTEVHPTLSILVDELRRPLASRYLQVLVDRVRACLQTPVGVDELYPLVRVLATEASFQGFDRRQLQWMGKQVINAADHANYQTDLPLAVEEMLQRIESAQTESYEVFFRIDLYSEAIKARFPRSIPGLEVLEVIQTPHRSLSDWGTSRPNKLYLKVAQDAVDPYSAARTALAITLESLSLVNFCNTSLNLSLHSRCWSASAQHTFAYQFPTQAETLGPLALHSEGLAPKFSQYKTILAKPSLERDSSERLQVALRAFRGGLASRTPTDQFLGLWVGLETLVVGGTSSSVKELRTFAVQAMAVQYPRSLLRDLLENLRRLDVLRMSGRAFSPDPNIGCIELWVSFLDDGFFQTWASKVEVHSPILAFRMKAVQGDFAGGTALKALLERHTRHLGQNLQRMFRVRNSIVHGGYVPNDLTQLSSHLLFYFWSTLRVVIKELATRASLNSIEQVAKKTAFVHENLLSILKANDLAANLDTLLDPQSWWPTSC